MYRPNPLIFSDIPQLHVYVTMLLIFIVTFTFVHIFKTDFLVITMCLIEHEKIRPVTPKAALMASNIASFLFLCKWSGWALSYIAG